VAEGGYAATAWVHPSERFGRELLTNTVEAGYHVDYHHGGFVFVRRRAARAEGGEGDGGGDSDAGYAEMMREPVLYQLMTKEEYAFLDKPPRREKLGPLLSDAVARLQGQSAAAVAIQEACTADLFAPSAHSGKEESRDQAAEVNFVTASSIPPIWLRFS